jgi:phosphatidylglycerol---prolipoprotein diacylglyceryl transferase
VCGKWGQREVWGQRNWPSFMPNNYEEQRVITGYRLLTLAGGFLIMFHFSPHPELHPVFETLGYALGFGAYKAARRHAGDVLQERQRWSVIAAAMVGALIGSRVLGVLEQAPRLPIGLAQWFTPGGGKTIVGGLLGGWIAVEIVKKIEGIRSRTGDLFALPLCFGIGVGRIGCYLAGLADDTYGKPSGLPWSVDFGDGIARHPIQAYEIVFLAGLALVLRRWAKRPHAPGALFQAFLTAYLVWRLLIDFLKPQPLLAGLSLIQWACCAGLVAIGIRYVRDRRNAASGLTLNPMTREVLNR